MPREIPVCPPKPNPAPAAARKYEIELITPMFGGGVEPKVNDPEYPIRPTTIRGQLQFWWRATVGAQYATLAEMRAAQSAIWGCTERASRVQVLVENVKPDRVEPKPCAEIVKDRQTGRWRTNWLAPFRVQNRPADDALPYALFPFQGKPDDSKGSGVAPAQCIDKLSFRLIVRCPPECWANVEPAIWAWVNFGGLGGRTRRGCGAVMCKELAPRNHAQLASQIKNFGLTRSDCEWPTVAESILVRIVEPSADPIAVWDWLVGRLKHFRQGEDFARNPNRGRSRYPEPETIRRIMHDPKRPWRHDRLEFIPDDAFPRAELGLPIVFHFQGQGEPPDTVICPSNSSDGTRRERMASPLILKPLALADGTAIPLILWLKTTPLGGVDLRKGDTSLSMPASLTIRDPRLSTYGGSNWKSPLAASPNGSALEAFLAFVRADGFTEATT